MDNKELDEILASIKNREQTVNEKINNSMRSDPGIEPPKPRIVEEKPKNEMPAPPDRRQLHSEPVTPPVIEPTPKEEVQSKPVLPLKKRISAVFSRIAKKNAKITAIIIALAVVAAVAVVGGIKYSQTAYLRPYEQKYGIEYPKGILESFCDQYGKNQNTAGSLYSPDIDATHYVTDRVQSGYSNLEKGTSIIKEQQFKSIKLSLDFAALEDIYSTAPSYTKSSQKIVFTSLYEKHTYQVIAAFYTNTDPKDDNNYCFNCYFAGDLTQHSFVQYRDRVQSCALYASGDTLSYNNSYLTLSMDSSAMTDYRFVLLCKEVDSDITKYTRAVANERVHYPQNYYDENGIVNPYRFARKWYPTIYTDKKQQVTTVLNN